MIIALNIALAGLVLVGIVALLARQIAPTTDTATVEPKASKAPAPRVTARPVGATF